MLSTARERLSFAALLAGATAIGFAPVLVRLSEVGPSATAFHRLVLSLPLLWIWMIWESRHGRPRIDSGPGRVGAGTFGRRAPLRLFVLAGVLFAGDLALWHWSIRLTSVANSTLLINFAPLLVMWGARHLFGERIHARLVAGMAMAVVGGALLVGPNLRLADHHLLGDGLGLVTALFYAGYLLSVKHLRRMATTAEFMALSGLVSAVVLLAVAWLSGEAIWPVSWRGWLPLVALALISHIGGQGLIGYAMAHLPASLSALSLLLQPVVATLLAAMVLGEGLHPAQGVGGAIILAGLAVASLGKPASSGQPDAGLRKPPGS